MNDNQLFSSFTMLTEHLYGEFVQYILNGRTRAPPETELIEMLPTFQFGAKTDRRAVQSKFKSWAKRMDFKNGTLILATTGKIIIPREICDDIIMRLHSEEHSEIESIINQIRRTYTWTRKNFGMDRDIVVESIMRNCRKEECMKKMRLEIAKLGNSFCTGISNIPVPGMIPQIPFGMSSPLPYLPAYHYPLPIPFTPVFSPSRFPFPFPFIKDLPGFKNSNIATSETNRITINKKEDALKSNFVSETTNATRRNNAPIAQSSSSGENVVHTKFIKPKNLQDYKILMKAVQKNPKAFPKILGSKKSQFLLSLGIAPKVICSTRTLKKFRRELKNKQFMTRDCMIYRERKMLRDRNKLKRSSDKKRHNYLGHLLLRNSNLPRYETHSSATQQYQSYRIDKEIFGKQMNDYPQSKRVKVTNKKRPIEVITIDISDEEKEVQEEKLQEDEKVSSIEADFSDHSLENETEQLGSNNVGNVEKTDDLKKEKEMQNNCLKNFDSKEISGKENMGENNCTETTQSQQTVPEKCRKAVLNENPILQFINRDASNTLPSNSDSKENYFPVSQIAIVQSKNVNAATMNSTANLAEKLNPTVGLIRRTTTILPQSLKTLEPFDQNINPRIVYPIKLTRAKPFGTFLMNQKQKGPYMIVPSFNRTPLSQNNIQPKKLVNSKLPSTMSSVFSPRFRQIKPMPTEKTPENYKNLFRMGESSKIDINKEMERIATWIYKMKSILNPCTLSNAEEKSVQKLMAQLDFGIHLVREAKKSLKEIEHIVDASECPIQVTE